MARALLGLNRAALEFISELLDPTGGVDNALFTGVSGVRVRGHVAKDDEEFNSIDDLLTGRLHRGFGLKPFAARNIEITNVVEYGMAFGFHGFK